MSMLWSTAAFSSRSFQLISGTAGMAVLPQVQPALRTLFTSDNSCDSLVVLVPPVTGGGFSLSVVVSSFLQENKISTDNAHRIVFILSLIQKSRHFLLVFLRHHHRFLC